MKEAEEIDFNQEDDKAFDAAWGKLEKDPSFSKARNPIVDEQLKGTQKKNRDYARRLLHKKGLSEETRKILRSILKDNQ